MDKIFRKNYIVLLITFVLFNLIANDEELFLQANQLYKQKDYSNALMLYNKISQKGSAVLCNIGNCYFHQDDYPQALVYWLRAQKIASFSEYNEIEKNKEIVFKKIGKQEPQSFLASSKAFLDTIASFIPLLLLQLLFLLIFCGIALYHWKRSNRNKKIISHFLWCWLFLLGILLNIEYKKTHTQYGIITHNNISLFTGPHKDFSVVGPLGYTNQVVIQEQRDGWYKVKQGPLLGWVEAEAVQIL